MTPVRAFALAVILPTGLVAFLVSVPSLFQQSLGTWVGFIVGVGVTWGTAAILGFFSWRDWIPVRRLLRSIVVREDEVIVNSDLLVKGDLWVHMEEDQEFIDQTKEIARSLGWSDEQYQSMFRPDPGF